MTSTRIAAGQAPGHAIDRSTPVTFTVDGTSYTGLAGDTVASALLAAGRIECGPSMYLGRPRGILAAGVEEPNALLTVAPSYPGDIAETMLPATTVRIAEGLSAHFLSGLGKLDATPDEARYEHKYRHVDVLVVGGGPAGLAAAREAAKSGARTMLIDDQPAPGGSLLSERGARIDDTAALQWADQALARLQKLPDFTYLPRTSAFGSYDENFVTAVENTMPEAVAGGAVPAAEGATPGVTMPEAVAGDAVPAAAAPTPAASRPSPGVPRQRVWHIRAARVVLATGAHERPIVFAGNDRPGVMLAGAVRTYLNRYGVAAGQNVAVATMNDSAYALVADLVDSGIAVAAVIDSRPEPSAAASRVIADTGVRALFGAAVVDTRAAHATTPTPAGSTAGARAEATGVATTTMTTTSATTTAAAATAAAATPTPAGAGNARVASIVVANLDDDGNLVPGTAREIATDLLAVSGGFSPVVHLHTQRQGQVAWDEDLAGFVPSSAVKNQYTAGSLNGVYTLREVLSQGATAGHRAAADAGFATTLMVPEAAHELTGPVRPLWLVPPLDPAEGSADAASTGADSGRSHDLAGQGPDGATAADYSTHFVDLQRDQAVRDVLRATGAGMEGIEHVKRYTSISTANDQGKTSGINAIGVIAALRGVLNLGELGSTSHRAPFTPLSFAAAAGSHRGELFDPARVTSIQPWHLAHGAIFEDVGQWKRPRYYPQPGEDMDAAVLRECAAVRTSVGFQDASTLGKIEIKGADAAEFINRIYTNGFKKLKPGKARYGIMCKPDGMIFDDGTSLRISDDRFLMTTTTGNAAVVLEWLEEWHQTEWPELDVFFTSVTEQWSAIAVAGPKSREVIAKLVPDLDVSNDALPFMAFADTELDTTLELGAAGLAAPGLTAPGGASARVPARICRISFSGELAFEIHMDTFYGQAVWEAVAAAGAEFDITPYGTEAMHVLRAEKAFIIVGQDTDGTVTPQDAGMEWVVSKIKKDFIGKRSFDRADNHRADRKHLVAVLPVDKTTLLPEGAQLVEPDTPITPAAGPVPMIGHVTSSYRSAALDRTFGLALVVAGRERIGQVVKSFVGGDELVDVQIAEPVLYDPEGSRRDG